MHRAEAIFNQVVTTITGLVTTGSRVHKSRVYAVDKFPAINVFLGSEVNPQYSSAYIDSDLNITTKILVKITEDSLVTDLLKIRREIHVAMMADPTLGLSYVIDCLPVEMSEPQISDEQETPTATVDIKWLIRYRTPINDPGV